MIKTFLAGACFGLAIAITIMNYLDSPEPLRTTDRIIFGTDTVTITSNYGCSMDFTKLKGVKSSYWNQDRTIFTSEILKPKMQSEKGLDVWLNNDGEWVTSIPARKLTGNNVFFDSHPIETTSKPPTYFGYNSPEKITGSGRSKSNEEEYIDEMIKLTEK